jgi:hypothetical protein
MVYFGYITVGEQPSKDETKYMKQGANPQRKRRAPDPPVSFLGKSASDIRQLNSNVSERSRPIVCFFVFGVTGLSGPWPPHSRGF